MSNSTLRVNARTDSSESEMDESLLGSPRTPRKAKTRPRRRTNTVNSNISNNNNENATHAHDLPEIIDELAYIDTLPEEVKLVEVTSNIWGTKFKIHGLAKTVPANLGQVTYKTSLLHLQPRQMTLVITELRDDYPTGPDPSFNPNIFSEDEEEHILLVPNNSARRHIDGSLPPIAPMSPRPGRFSPRSRASQQPRTVEKQTVLGPLAKTESYEDEFSGGETSDSHNHAPVRPKNIETSSSRPGPSYASLVTQYSRSASSSSGQSRHAISPLCSEGSVPTLQSPKNAVGPSDIIFDRPPPGQTTLMNYSSNADYSNHIGQVKSALMPEQVRINSQVTPVPLNLNLNLERTEPKAIKDKLTFKKKDLQFIDDTPTTSAAVQITEPKIPRTTTIVSIAPAGIPDSMTRSCSVGYLDSVDIVPSDVALSLLRKEAPNKRLVLVDRKPKKAKKSHDDNRRMKQLKCAKSKSLDLCDLLQTSPKLININNNIDDNVDQGIVPKHNGSTDENTLVTTNSSGCSANSSNITKAQVNYSDVQPMRTLVCPNKMGAKHSAVCHGSDLCTACQKTFQEILVENNSISSHSSSSHSSTTRNMRSLLARNACDLIQSEPTVKASSSKSGRSQRGEPEGKPPRGNQKKAEIITSYTDSPLFSRKHRFGDDSSSSSRFMDSRSPTLGRRFENGLSFIKQLSEARKRRKEENLSASTVNSSADLRPIEAIPVEQKSSISLHTQALTTLENIISRLRDLDEGRTPPASPQLQRHPRSSPASPAPSKKGRRHQSASPIRQILNSPLLNRRHRKKQSVDSSDDESINGNSNQDDHSNKQQYRDLETFQKAQLRQKVSKKNKKYTFNVDSINNLYFYYS